ncbi:hypothetical protein LX36DRAFT_658878 [Colletotrichum falcatum]|nr:hypothetical protein LX36DRAFT_658878 [Colletotrichum falcatum]
MSSGKFQAKRASVVRERACLSLMTDKRWRTAVPPPRQSGNHSIHASQSCAWPWNTPGVSASRLMLAQASAA